MQVLVQQRNFLSVISGSNFANDYARAREISKASTHSFGALQKVTYGFGNLLASVMRLFEQRMVSPPDSVVIPHGSFGILNHCKPESRVFALCGKVADSLELKDPKREFLTNIYNNQFQVFEHRPMSISQDSAEVNMLTRSRDVGNCFRVFRDVQSYGSSPTHTAIKIVDHDKQRWRTITLADTLVQSGAFDDEGYLKNDFWALIAKDFPMKDPKDAEFGDIKAEYLKRMNSDLSRNLATIDFAVITNPNSQDISRSGANTFHTNIGSQAQSSQPELPSSSVSDVASAIVSAATGGGEVGRDAEIQSAAKDLAKATERLSPKLRGAIAQVIGSKAGLFGQSRDVMQNIEGNKNKKNAASLRQSLIGAIGEDFRSNWTDVSKAARRLVAEDEARLAAPIGARQAGDRTDTTQTGNVPTFSNSAKIEKWKKTKITLANIINMDERGILTPFGAYVMRPFQSFEMGSIVVMKAGTDTGMTVVGNSDFQLGDSVQAKTHLGHFTFYFESIVHEPNHVMTVRDAMFMRYNGGAGGRWAKYNSNVDDDGSLFAVLAMHWESYDEYMHDPIDLTGSFDKGSVLSPLDYDGENHYHFSSIYTDLFSAVAADGSWSGGGATTADATEKPFFVESLANRICYQGLQYNRGQSGEFTEPVTNTGHLGDSESVDSSLTWSGHMALKTPVSYHRGGNGVSLFNPQS
jgi:hypothetical protein